MQRIMDDGRTPDQRRCGKTWKRLVVEFGESVHFRPVGENNAVRGGDQRLLRCPCGTSREIWCCDFPHARWCEERNENCKDDGTRDGIACSVQRVLERNLVRPVVPEAEAEQGVAPVIVMPAVPKVDHQERSCEVGVHRRVSSMYAVGVRYAQCETSS